MECEKFAGAGTFSFSNRAIIFRKNCIDDSLFNEENVRSFSFVRFEWEMWVALVAQSVERVLGKDEVGSSSLLGGSIRIF